MRRPTGRWSASVHRLLRHLEQAGVPAPRFLGVDERGREVLTFVEGEVVWPEHPALLEADDSLAEVASLVRRYHDALATFRPSDRDTWSTRAADPTPGPLVCHNDLGPWNLVRSSDGWSFIDWDLAAPARPAWDLAWALLGLIPLTPDRPLDDASTRRRLRVFADGYGGVDLRAVLVVAGERARREAEAIRRAEGVDARLLAEGHAEIWAGAAEQIERRRRGWL